MKPHPRFIGMSFMVCLLAGVTNVQARQQGWSATGSLGAERSYGREIQFPAAYVRLAS